MAQFDVHRNPVTAARKAYPFVIVLQSDVIPATSQTVIAPLVLQGSLSGGAGRLAPVVQIDETRYAALVRQLATVPVRELGQRVANVAQHRETLLGATDLLFYGV